MPWIMVVLLTVAGTFAWAPLIEEHTNDPCDALLSAAVSISAKDGSLSPIAVALGAPFVEAFLTKRFSGYPAYLTCTTLYWRMQFGRDPSADLPGTE